MSIHEGITIEVVIAIKARKKNFRASTKICVSAAILYQLSYERPIHWKKVNLLSSPHAIFFLYKEKRNMITFYCDFLDQHKLLKTKV